MNKTRAMKTMKPVAARMKMSFWVEDKGMRKNVIRATTMVMIRM